MMKTRKTYGTRMCAYCGREYEARKPWQRSCTPKHRRALSVERRLGLRTDESIAFRIREEYRVVLLRGEQRIEMPG